MTSVFHEIPTTVEFVETKNDRFEVVMKNLLFRSYFATQTMAKLLTRGSEINDHP